MPNVVWIRFWPLSMLGDACEVEQGNTRARRTQSSVVTKCMTGVALSVAWEVPHLRPRSRRSDSDRPRNSVASSLGVIMREEKSKQPINLRVSNGNANA